MADLDAVRALCAALPHAPHWPRTTWQAMLEAASGAQRFALAAVVSGLPVGVAIVSVTPPEADLESIAVADAFQRQGIASALMAELSTRLSAAGVTSVLLEVRVSNSPAQALYTALGFAPVGRRPGYYADPIEDALVLRLSLP
ncbi:MAG: ribosomal protein S18-alanine N-acetyltransferase [Terracidiphilus sp.]|nr:ribosomal protein S18-alanine N-acetyltransferase [Terracidiphilus sp.]